jgi:4-amino-4-deoxy-L-arabinose transferase-like glycosyltransferase
VRELVRRHKLFFLVFAAAALALRAVFFWKLRFVDGDSFVYGDIAKNWLQHHIYGLTDLGHGSVAPTLIRLPGYPAFLALVWMLAGVEHYDAVMLAQIAIDLGICCLMAGLALEVAGPRAARWAFALTALCPFFANFAATPLTETPAIFVVALAFFCAAKACTQHDDLRWWAGVGGAVAAGILLRPDGGILLAALGAYFGVRLLRAHAGLDKRRVVVAGALVAVLALAPLAPWTVRNWRVFHLIQPLAPRYANDPSEIVTYGYFLWTKTWLIDYVSIEDFYWRIPGQEVDAEELPARACDSPEQCRRTRELFEAYNDGGYDVTPELDARFAELAQERIAQHPVRYYVELPLARVANLWLRPRIEMLPLNSHWWQYDDDPHDARIGIMVGLINLFYVFCAAMGAATRRVRLAALMLGWVALRTAFLGTLEAPESRYTLECFPVVIVLAAAWLAGEPKRSS